jgi:hypothetical protein
MFVRVTCLCYGLDSLLKPALPWTVLLTTLWCLVIEHIEIRIQKDEGTGSSPAPKD